MRKYLSAALLILLIASANLANSAQDDWVKYSSPENRFTVALPHEPKLAVENSSSTSARRTTFSDLEQGYAFILEEFYKSGIINPERYLDGVTAGIVKTINGSLTSETRITLDGYPGRELELAMRNSKGEDFIVITRTFAVGDSLYTMSFIRQKSMDAALAARIGDRFFSSIKFARVD